MIRKTLFAILLICAAAASIVLSPFALIIAEVGREEGIVK